MKRTHRGMPLRTAALTWFLDTVGRVPIEEASEDDLAAARAKTYPTRAPFTWITGRVERGVRLVETTAPVRDGSEVGVRWYLPTGGEDLPVVVFFHGGGWVQGNVPMYDPLCSHLAAAVPAVVVSVDYRLAPEHRAPTAATDACDVTSWVASPTGVEVAASLGVRYDPSRVGLAGDSAGGNLAAVVAQQLRDLTGSAGEPAIRHQALIYPATDLTLASPSITENAHAPVLDEAAIHAFREHYLGPDAPEEACTDPLVSPLFGDLVGLAPAVVQAAELDPIRDDATRYAAAMRSAGVEVRETTYRRLPHGFASFPGATPTGMQAREEVVAEMRRYLARG